MDQSQLVFETCAQLGDLERYAATEITAGRLTMSQVDKVDAAQKVAQPLCADPATTAASASATSALRAAVPAIAAALGKD